MEGVIFLSPILGSISVAVILFVILYRFFMPSLSKLPFSRTILRGNPFFSLLTSFLFITGLLILTFYAANPVTAQYEKSKEYNTHDFTVLLDVSNSMKDMVMTSLGKKSKIEISKNILSNFIQQREGDRFSVILFAQNPLTLFPMSDDYKLLQKMVKAIEPKPQIIGSTTKLDKAIIMGLRHLEATKIINKFLIIITDGEYKPEVDELEIKKYFKKVGVKVFVAHIDSDKNGYLESLSTWTNGRYYHADDFKKIEPFFDSIEKKEIVTESKRLVDYVPYKQEYIILAFALLILSEILSRLFLRRIM